MPCVTVTLALMCSRKIGLYGLVFSDYIAIVCSALLIACTSWHCIPAAGVDYYGHVFNFTHVDPHIDWFSIDMYHLDIGTAGTAFVSSVHSFYETYVFPKMSANQLGMYTACAVGRL
jgi:hypothetical protein